MSLIECEHCGSLNDRLVNPDHCYACGRSYDDEPGCTSG